MPEMSAGSSTGPPPGGFLVASTGHGSVRSSSSRQGDPPREAKEGHEWVWYPDGYWAERQLERQNSNREATGSQSSSQGSQMQSAVNKVFRWGPSRGSRSPREPQQADPTERVESVSPMTTTTPSLGQKSLSPFAPPKTLPSSPYMSEEEQTLSLQHPGKKDTWTRFNSRAAPIAELISHGRRLSSQPIGPKPSWGALRKTKEGEGGLEANEPQRTETALDSAPSYFTQKPIRPPREPEPSDKDKIDAKSSQPEPTPAPRGLRKWFRKLPRPRKRPGTARPSQTTAPLKSRAPDGLSGSSSSSSPIGFTNRPVLTEMPTKSTTTSRSTISYPAGEAVHVETPPLKHLTASGQPRSLFMDIQHPVPLEDESSNSSDTFSPKARVLSYRKSQTGEKREWWDAPKKTVRRDPVKDVSFFEFDLPEHLPSSPMCPANPKHQGRGKMVCVYHGRGKQMSSDDEDADQVEDDEDVDCRMSL